MSYGQRLVKGLSIVFLMSFLASVVAYGTKVYLARVMQPAEYGLLYAVYTFVVFFLFFRDFGSHQALAYYVAKFKVEEKFDEIKTAIVGTFLIQLVTSLVLVIPLWILGGFLAESYFQDSRAEYVLYAFLVYVLLSSFFRVIKAVFWGFGDMFQFSSCELFKNALILIATLVLFHFSTDRALMGALAYGIVAAVMVVALLPIMLRKYFPWGQHKVDNLRQVVKDLLAYGLPVTFTGMGGDLIAYADVLMLTYLANLHDVGIYSAMLTTAVSILFVSRSVVSVIFPMMSEMWAKGEKWEMTRIFFVLERYAFLFVFPALILIALYAQEIIGLLFGASYVEGALAFQIVVISTLLYVVASISNTIISATGRPQDVTKVIFIGAIVNILGNLIAIPLYGYYGAAVMTALSYFVVYVLSLRQVVLRVGGHVPWKQHGLMIIALGIFTGILIGLNSVLPFGHAINGSISFLVSGVVYFLFCHVTKLIQFAEIRRNIVLILRFRGKKIQQGGNNE
ncbi:flippase [Candidatus Woesearchaeota archaeon]|nr:flippase [Candidatus Woesearchaeota archaeon]